MRSFRRFLAVFATVALLTLLAASTVLAGERNSTDGTKAADELVLTYTKWFAPAYPNMEGVIGGAITGTFGGAVLDRSVLPSGVVLLRARYEIIANNPSRSFTALIQGTADSQGVAVLNGVVTAGWLTGEPVHVEFRTIFDCPKTPFCFTGSIRVMEGLRTKALSLVKTCPTFDTTFTCVVTTSTLEILRGGTFHYLQPQNLGGTGSPMLITTATGVEHGTASGTCRFVFPAGHCIFSSGTGSLAGFHADLYVLFMPGAGLNFSLLGTYYVTHGHSDNDDQNDD